MKLGAQFRRRASAVPNLIQLGSTVARQKYDCDSDVVPESYRIQDLLYWSHMTVSQQRAIKSNWCGFPNWSKTPACNMIARFKKTAKRKAVGNAFPLATERQMLFLQVFSWLHSCFLSRTPMLFDPTARRLLRNNYVRNTYSLMLGSTSRRHSVCQRQPSVLFLTALDNATLSRKK